MTLDDTEPNVNIDIPDLSNWNDVPAVSWHDLDRFLIELQMPVGDVTDVSEMQADAVLGDFLQY